MCRDGDVHRRDAFGSNGDVAGHCGHGASGICDLRCHGGKAVSITVEAHDAGPVSCHAYGSGSPDA